MCSHVLAIRRDNGGAADGRDNLEALVAEYLITPKEK